MVERHEMPLDEYYDGLHDVVDSSAYRAARSIVLLEGSLFGASGELLQEFRSRYGPAYAGGRVVDADDSVTED